MVNPTISLSRDPVSHSFRLFRVKHCRLQVSYDSIRSPSLFHSCCSHTESIGVRRKRPLSVRSVCDAGMENMCVLFPNAQVPLLSGPFF